MLADVDRLVTMADGKTAILECKTTNYNARDKWEYDGKPIVPQYYEAQGRHYMAVMNLDRVYYCCLYGNSEDDVIIRSIDRDPDYEAELIALEENFWTNHVQAKTPPPYIEDKPFYTVEVHGDRIIQVRGANNCAPTPEVHDFLEAWEKKKHLKGAA